MDGLGMGRGDPLNVFGQRGPFNGGDPSTQGGAFNQALSGGNTPQQQGYGIGEPGAFTPYRPNQGMQRGGYNASFDLSKPGAAESFWGQAQQMAPGQAGLDPYYNRQAERLTGRMNDQLAARGQFGSGRGMQQIGDALAGLGAEQANREAAFQLQQMGSLGQLAGQAQAAQQGRIGDVLAAQMGLGDRLSGQYLDQINRMFDEEQALFQATMTPEQGLAQQATEQGYRNQERHKADADWAGGLFGNILGGIVGK